MMGEVTSVQAAHTAFSNAVDRLRKLEAEADAAFREYDAARERMTEIRVQADVELTPGIAAAFSNWKQAKAASEGATIAREDWPARPGVAA